jgi:hypothetical protein
MLIFSLSEVFMYKRILQLAIVAGVCVSLSGCLLAAAGAGYYAGSKYKVTKRHP